MLIFELDYVDMWLLTHIPGLKQRKWQEKLQFTPKLNAPTVFEGLKTFQAVQHYSNNKKEGSFINLSKFPHYLPIPTYALSACISAHRPATADGAILFLSYGLMQ